VEKVEWWVEESLGSQGLRIVKPVLWDGTSFYRDLCLLIDSKYETSHESKIRVKNAVIKASHSFILRIENATNYTEIAFELGVPHSDGSSLLDSEDASGIGVIPMESTVIDDGLGFFAFGIEDGTSA